MILLGEKLHIEAWDGNYSYCSLYIKLCYMAYTTRGMILLVISTFIYCLASVTFTNVLYNNFTNVLYNINTYAYINIIY